jgi:hypothetical protein
MREASALPKTRNQFIESLIEDKDALTAFLEMRVSDSEIYAQGAGGTAAIVYKDGEEEKTVYFVHETALTLMVKGAERTYNPGTALLQASTETVYYPKLFLRIVQSLETERKYAFCR